MSKANNSFKYFVIEYQNISGYTVKSIISERWIDKKQNLKLGCTIKAKFSTSAETKSLQEAKNHIAPKRTWNDISGTILSEHNNFQDALSNSYVDITDNTTQSDSMIFHSIQSDIRGEKDEASSDSSEDLHDGKTFEKQMSIKAKKPVMTKHYKEILKQKEEHNKALKQLEEIKKSSVEEEFRSELSDEDFQLPQEKDANQVNNINKSTTEEGNVMKIILEKIDEMRNSIKTLEKLQSNYAGGLMDLRNAINSLEKEKTVENTSVTPWVEFPFTEKASFISFITYAYSKNDLKIKLKNQLISITNENSITIKRGENIQAPLKAIRACLRFLISETLLTTMSTSVTANENDNYLMIPKVLKKTLVKIIKSKFDITRKEASEKVLRVIGRYHSDHERQLVRKQGKRRTTEDDIHADDNKTSDLQQTTKKTKTI